MLSNGNNWKIILTNVKNISQLKQMLTKNFIYYMLYAAYSWSS